MCAIAGDDAIIAAATTGFLDRTNPEPGFLLYIPSTDSTPPPAAVQAMQDRRTTYLYSTDPSQQAVVEKRIASYGGYDVLLVVYHGLTRAERLRPVVTFTGHYVGNSAARGKTIGPYQITPQCGGDGTWQPPLPTPTAPPGRPGAGGTPTSPPRAS
jgi:hypothetical protein